MRRRFPVLATLAAASVALLGISSAGAQTSSSGAEGYSTAGAQTTSQSYVMYDRETGQPLIYRQYSQSGMGASAIPREVVQYDGKYAPGTIVVSTQEKRLYYILPGKQAVRYGIGVGRPGFQWGGVKTVSAKREWPDWTPPAQMLKRRPDLPRWMPGGPSNPLGARAMYLGSSLFRIHGSNEPHTIGQEVSSGCFRMTNDDVVDLYDRVKVGTRVVVLR